MFIDGAKCCWPSACNGPSTAQTNKANLYHPTFSLNIELRKVRQPLSLKLDIGFIPLMSFWQTLSLLSQKSTSSTQWVSRQSRDPYVKKRVSDPAAYRGAAPGGWSQVVAGKFGWGNTRTKQLHDSKTGTSEDGNACSFSGQDGNDCALGVEVHSDSQFLFSEDKRARKKKRRVRKPIEDELEHYDPLNMKIWTAFPCQLSLVAVLSLLWTCCLSSRFLV